MVSIKEVDANVLIKKLAKELKEKIEMPEWAKYVKTGVSRERPPEQKDWWWIRAASILRRVYLDGPVGTQKLRSYYGGLKRRGHKPSHFKKSGGKIIRTILQQLENAELIKKAESKKRGRVITPKGQSLLNKIIKEIGKGV